MGRKHRNAAKKKTHTAIEELVPPTPEQLAHGGYQRDYVMDDNTGLKALAYVNHGMELNGRQFKQAHFDRLYKSGVITDEQYLAGKWYRDTHERGKYGNPSMSNLFRVSGSVGCAEDIVDYTQMARDKWRAARKSWPVEMTGFMDALLLHNCWPKMHHRERFRTVGRIREALDYLAHHLRKSRS